MKKKDSEQGREGNSEAQGQKREMGPLKETLAGNFQG